MEDILIIVFIIIILGIFFGLVFTSQTRKIIADLFFGRM